MGGLRRLDVPGDPVPQGNMRAYAVAGRAFVTGTNTGPLARYRNDIRHAYGEPDLHKQPVMLTITFGFRRPKSHYNAKGGLKDSTYAQPAPIHHTNKPDIDKLIRAVLDALTSVEYHDDSQVAHVQAHKVWAEVSHTLITIGRVGLAEEGGGDDEQD